MNIKTSILALLTLVLAVSVPLSASAATSKKKESASFTESTLIATSTKPVISGEASNVKSVRVNIYKEGSTKPLYKGKSAKVKSGDWSTKVSKTIPNGTYDIVLYGPKGVTRNTLATSTLVIDTSGKSTRSAKAADTTFVVEALPLLVGGSAKQSSSVPMSYLQVTNIGKNAGVVKGFWVKQNGSASTKAVIGLTTVDDSGLLKGSVGGVEGATPFKDNVACVPVPDVTIGAGQMKLFTIKADITSSVSQYLGSQLMIDVTGIDTNAKTRAKFPIRGTTWNLAR